MNADRFDITRVPPPGWHLHTFGGGVHYCLGAILARLELTEALAELSLRFGQLHLDGEPSLPQPGNVVWGVRRYRLAGAERRSNTPTPWF